VKRYSTSYLLTVAALAAATGVLLVGGNWLAYATAAIPLLNAAIIGVWALPFAAALRLLRLPGTVLLVSLLAGIVMGPFQQDGFRAIYVNLWFGFFFEIFFAVTLYRIWRTWLFVLAGAANGLIWAVSYAFVLAAENWAIGAIIALVAIATVSSAAFAWFGVLVADALARAGVAKNTRRAIERADAERAAKRTATAVSPAGQDAS
jgi:energy-coupling factor transport system substrate-specific component